MLLQASTIQLKPRTPRLQEQWRSLLDLFHQEQLFRESSVLQLGLTPEDAVPLPALGAVSLGEAAFARIYAPRWARQSLRSLRDFLNLGTEERLRPDSLTACGLFFLGWWRSLLLVVCPGGWLESVPKPWFEAPESGGLPARGPRMPSLLLRGLLSESGCVGLTIR